jgi:hypothetical protein
VNSSFGTRNIILIFKKIQQHFEKLFFDLRSNYQLIEYVEGVTVEGFMRNKNCWNLSDKRGLSFETALEIVTQLMKAIG